MTQACLDPTKSVDTASVEAVKPICCCKFECSAFFRINSLSSSRAVSRSSCKLKIAIETLGVGTLIALPVSLPFNSGITFETAFAAPVEVSTIFNAALRPLRPPL